MGNIVVSIALALAGGMQTPGDQPEKLASVEFRGDIAKSKNLSGVAAVGDLLVIGADEGGKVQILKDKGDHYKLVGEVVLDASGKEIDIEGIASDGDVIYVMGSHSGKREKVDAARTLAENRAAIATSGPEPCRDRLFRFTIDAEGRPSPIRVTSLRPLIDADAVLKTFRKVPSKENGVDIEGIASDDGHLYAGFRGPVLRENFTPILRFAFAEPVVTAGELLFVDLGGRGVRDLTRARGGFLILAGPVGDGPGTYRLYFWDGRDCLPGRRDAGQAGRIVPLATIPTPDDAKAEGIALLKETDASYEFLIVYDGLKDGGATRFRVAKP